MSKEEKGDMKERVMPRVTVRGEELEERRLYLWL